jgi:hypothetical protein
MATMTRSRKRKADATLKRRRTFVCRFVSGKLEVIATRKVWVAADRLSEKTPGSFLVGEFIVTDPGASDDGSLCWYDANGGNMEAYCDIFYRIPW